jgi:crotonobetainyl-CoA:carnitine CoA-transferase CaiB-like acyl-CoA transferase
MAEDPDRLASPVCYADELEAKVASAPLAGLKVLDLSRILAGPYATQILGDHGADVIKIEPPQGDDTREWGPPFIKDAAGAPLSSAYFLGANRNKRGLALDLARAEGREVLMRLLASADVLIENFKTGTMERWGLGFERDLAPLLPRLIYGQISGFGADGPLGGYPGYDAVAQAMTGLMSVNASPQSGPTRVGVPIVDIAAAMNLAIGVLMALEARHHTGRGRRVDVALYDTGLSLIHPQAANWLMGARAPLPLGNAHPNISPYDSFETASGPIFLGIGNDRQFEIACKMLGAPELARDARFRTNGLRSENRAELRSALERLLADKNADALAAEFLAAGVPAGAVATLEAACAAPHTAHAGMILEDGPYRGVASPIRINGEDRLRLRPPPRFAEHTDEILREARYTEEEIAELVASGVIVKTKRS